MSVNKIIKDSYLFILPWTLTSLGGVNQVVENLFCQMKSDSTFNPILMVNSWSDINIRKQNINGIDHYFFRLRSPWYSLKKVFNFIAFSLYFFQATFHFYEFIKTNRVAIINVHYCSLFALNVTLMKSLRVFRGQLILSFHGKDLLIAKQSHGIEKILWKKMLSSADKIVVVSESLKREIVDFEASVLKKTVTIYNGIDMSFISKNEDRHIDFNFKNKKYLLCVGTLESIKGQDILLKAFKIISQDYVDICLVFIGRPGGTENQIKQLVDSLGLSQRVHLYEGLPHSQVLAIMKRAMVFVLPSRFEAFGIVILEAGAFGVPVIASNVGGIREIITHSQTGRLCEPEDIDSMAEEISNLLKKQDERNRLGRNLKNHILSNFSWKRTYQKYIEAIRG